MYCSKCGSKQPEGALFCHNCGARLQTGEAPQETVQQPDVYLPVKKRSVWLIPVIVVGTVLAAVIMRTVIFSIFGVGQKDKDSGEAPSSSAQVEVADPIKEPSGTEPGEALERYENSEVKFAIDYPVDFELSEPNANNALFGSGDECRVAVEYAHMTTGGSFIYSGADFIEQAAADQAVINGWIGAEDVELKGTDEGEYGGQTYTAFVWELSQNGKDYDGALYVFDSKGEFGCYTVLTMVERGCENEAALRENIDVMLESFEITGAYETAGVSIYGSEVMGTGIRFMVQDGRVQGRMDMEDDHVLIVPADGSFSDSSIRIQQNTVYSPDKHTVERTLEGCGNYYLKYEDKGRYITDPAKIEVGRYDCTEVDLQYTEGGEEHVASIIIFPYDGAYWEVTMLSSESNLELTRQVLGEVLASLCIDGDGGNAGPAHSAGKADMNQVIDEILTKIEGASGFIAPDDYYQPLASLTDVDGNGIYEFIAVYRVKEKGDYKALYDVYRIEDGEYASLRTGFELYEEVGGNSGTVGLVVDKAMRPYLKVETKSPQGDRFNNTLVYTPWNSAQTGFDGDTVYLECHGAYGEEDKGEYIIGGGTKVDKAAYEARQTEFMSLWTDLDLNRGPGNGGNNMSFEQIRTLDMNDYAFDSVN